MYLLSKEGVKRWPNPSSEGPFGPAFYTQAAAPFPREGI
jgi:hypothetical protein